jgi:hypothetical protein
MKWHVAQYSDFVNQSSFVILAQWKWFVRETTNKMRLLYMPTSCRFYLERGFSSSCSYAVNAILAQ